MKKSNDKKGYCVAKANVNSPENQQKYGKLADFIDLSGGLETSGLKDQSKIDIFLNKVKQIKNET